MNTYLNYYPFGSSMPGRTFTGSNKYRYSFNGMEKDDEVKGSGNHYSFGDFGYDPRLGRRWNIDPVIKHWESGYATFANNPIWFIDPDGYDVIPTNDLKANASVNSLLTLASKNSVFKNVMKSFYANQNHVYIHLAQLKDKAGNPSGFTNTARTQSYKSKNNPVGKFGIHRIILNKDLLSSDGVLRVDKTFVFRALLHEGIHARMYERYKQGKFNGFPGHKDFFKRGGEAHHNQMGAFNRQELIDGMKEFDTQLKKAGETVPEYHNDKWYDAMSWYGLQRTQAWKDYKKKNPDEAKGITKLIRQQIKRNKKAIESK